MIKRKLTLFLIFFLLILSLPSVKPFINRGFFPMHDDTQPARVYEMAKALSYGQFPVRWVPDLGYGYGYPLFNYYAPLPYYAGAIFSLSGLDAIISAKIMFVIGIILAGITMLLLVNYLANPSAGIASSLLYLYAPYHAVNIYVRGAVGEIYAYGFMPLYILGLVMIINKTKKDVRNGIILSSIGLAGIILSHNILGMITGYFTLAFMIPYLIYLIIKKSKLTVFFVLTLALFMGVGLSAFFALPAIAEKDYSNVSKIISGGSDYYLHFVTLTQLWDSSWGFAGSAPGVEDGMSFRIGKLHVIFASISIILLVFFYYWKRIPRLNLRTKQPVKGLYPILVIMFFISIFLMIEQSSYIWKNLPGFSFIQYPWRFLNFTVLYASILISVLFLALKKNHQLYLCLLILLLVLGSYPNLFTPQAIRSVKLEDYVSYDNLRNKISKISDEYLPANFVTPNPPNDLFSIDPTNPEVQIKTLHDTPTQKSYILNSKRSIDFYPNITYFPSWRAT